MTALDTILKVREENWKQKLADRDKKIAELEEEKTNLLNELAENKEQYKQLLEG